MHTRSTFGIAGLLLLVLVSGCATLETVVSAPEVRLRDVTVEKLDVSKQTFVLAFDVSNPNPFPLPVSTISYGMRLDGYRFASGETASAFTVPAGGDGEFLLSVDLNLLRTAPELLFIVREGAQRDIPYALEGRFGIDIPFAKPLYFETKGDVRLHAR